MVGYLSWGDMVSAAGEVMLNVVLACALASLLVYGFALFGRRYSLDQRVFPTVSASQRQWFGLLGFYLLLLTGIEILNPPTLDFVASGPISYKPSFLNAQFMGLAAQDLLSIAALAGLLVVFVTRIRQLNRMTSRFSRQEIGPLSRPDESRFGEKAKALKFAFSFASVSLLIAIIAPGLTEFGVGSIGTVVILGLFLIGGVSCYIEAMQLGAAYASASRGSFGLLLVRHVFLSQTALYVVLALVGFTFYAGLPGHYANDPNMSSMPELVRVVSKIVAGVLLVLMAFIVCWGLDGFSARLQRFMVVTALAPAILPMMKLLTIVLGRGDAISTDPGSNFAITYGIVLMVIPLLAYIYSSSDHPLLFGSKSSRMAYVRNMSWAPIAIGRTLAGRSDAGEIVYSPFSTAEELLEDMVGRKARGGPVSLPGSALLRHRLAAPLGWHHDYDAIVLDLRNTLRLFDALQQQRRLHNGQGGYRIVAGISRRQDVLIHRHHDDDGPEHCQAIWSDAPYMPRNSTLERHVLGSLRAYEPELKGIDFLPPNCILERLGPGDLAAVPEPFATDLLARTEARADTDRLPFDESDDSSWLFNNYDVLIVRQDEKGEYPAIFLDMLVTGREWLRTKKGPTGLGSAFARHVAAELEGVDVGEIEDDGGTYLNPAAVSVCLALTNFQDGAVIDTSDTSKDSNWSVVQDVHARMTAAGLLDTFDIAQLDAVIDCRGIEQRTAVEGARADYPLRVNRYLVNDTPGKVRDMLKAMNTGEMGLSYVHAQRVAGEGGMGLVYMLPTDKSDNLNVESKSHHHNWIASGFSGFLPVITGNEPGALEQLLEVVHLDSVLSIETMTAFPTSESQAIVLLSFGDIPQERLHELFGRLEDRGYAIPATPRDWVGTDLARFRNDAYNQADRPD